jgi:hypothetical protein
MDESRLLLLAQEPGEVPLVSALLQDAVVPASEIGFDARARRLALLASRYRWEKRDKTRVRCALRIESVLKAERRGWPASRDATLSLLSIAAEGDTLTLTFSGTASVRLTVECIDIVVEDLSAPWPAQRAPKHKP